MPRTPPETLVQPRLVAEFSTDRAIDHGGVYRHPLRFQRLRPDVRSAASASRIASCNPRTAEGSAGSALTPSVGDLVRARLGTSEDGRAALAGPASLRAAVAARVARPVSICTADNAMLPAGWHRGVDPVDPGDGNWGPVCVLGPLPEPRRVALKIAVGAFPEQPVKAEWNW
ncbi:hypothetical protein OG594_44430 [Streptomyces sp. NBC_01214]|uniref:hypothetical protein n=1 Tax=Streptomyces sp. NBC_01214 TaxID=2903777 RepID=UPI00224F3B37|nr:hypothetical protein [Streptomyces sp. NBC_01214]MCX4808555.1 hypothetical protein [Streptomyces sp. NBC_01214]